MPKKRLLAIAGVIVAAAAVAIVPMTASNAAEACAPAWNSSQVYVGGNTASQNGTNFRAKWWTQGQSPANNSGQWDVWANLGACGGGPSNPPTNPPGNNSGFPVSEAQFNQMFPLKIPFYSYSGLISAAAKFPGFAPAGNDTLRKREAAALLANMDHESGQLRYVEETNTANWPLYCDRSQPYGCPAGQSAYHGRGPIQLSWNFNYKAAGDYLRIDLLNNPDLVKNDASIAYQTAFWYWMSQNGPNSQTAHAAITGTQGFGGTIRSINGALECDGKQPQTVQNRVNTYLRFAQILGVDPGGNLYC